MIELTDVTRIYPMGLTEVRALDGVSLRVARGEFVAIVGPSGSGKSTMMHILGCLDRPTSGSYRLLDESVARLSDRQLARRRNRSIGFVFQTFNLITRMSAWENVALPMFYARRARTKPVALGALRRVNLETRADHQPNELSGGERQRVAIARAIVNDPPLIMADEPTGNLDSRTGAQIMEIFHRLHRAGTTVIVVTHEPDIAAQCERIVTMRDGRIVDDRPNPSIRPAPGEAEREHDAERMHGAERERDAERERSAERERDAGREPVRTGPARTPPAWESDQPAGLPGAATAVSVRAAPMGDAVPQGRTDSPVERIDATPPVPLPMARRALKWAIAGPACLLGLVAWGQTLRLVGASHPGFVKTAGPIVWLILAGVMFVGPVLGFVQGRRASRRIRLAPDRFNGLGTARAAVWVSGVHAAIVATLTTIVIVGLWVAIRTGGWKTP